MEEFSPIREAAELESMASEAELETAGLAPNPSTAPQQRG